MCHQRDPGAAPMHLLWLQQNLQVCSEASIEYSAWRMLRVQREALRHAFMHVVWLAWGSRNIFPQYKSCQNISAGHLRPIARQQLSASSPSRYPIHRIFLKSILPGLGAHMEQDQFKSRVDLPWTATRARQRRQGVQEACGNASMSWT